MSTRPIRRALVSVYDKTGLTDLAVGLHAAGIEIVSTGSTAATIEVAGVPVTPVSAVTGFPEILDGRVKTLHPHIHAGLLADTRNPAHVATLAELGIAPFELVVVNLYPFRETVASGAAPDEIVEQIDIGGPSMVRASAKNHDSVAVVVSPLSYPDVLKAVIDGGFTLQQRKSLATEAFRHTAAYDVAVASWLGSETGEDEFPSWIGGTWVRAGILRYGENPHQPAALYTSSDVTPGIAQARQLHGKEMSYNNYLDTDAARRAAYDHEQPCVAIIKHANPCGIAIADDVAAAHRLAHDCDPTSAFGGVIAVNRAVTLEMAEQVKDIFTEVICAPSYDDGVVEVLSRKPSIRILECAGVPQGLAAEMRPVSGGLLVQAIDRIDADGDDPLTWTLAAGSAVDAATLNNLQFAWRAIRSVKSNAILIVRDTATVGVGMGQVNRVDAARLAVARAGAARCHGAVAASDAFFPFPDGFLVLADAGIRAVVQPGGSVRDPEIVAAALEAGVTLYLTGVRHFAH